MRRAIMTVLIVVASEAAFLFAASAQNASATATVDSSAVDLGAWLHLTLEARLPAGADVFFPVLKDSIGPFDIVKTDSLMRSESGGSTIVSQRLTIASFREGTKTVPRIAIPYRVPPDTTLRYATTDSIVVGVRTVPVDTSSQMRDIKPPLAIPISAAEIALYAAIFAAAAGLAYLAYRYFRKKKGTNVEIADERPKIPSHILALQKLEQLESKRLWQQGEIKQFYTGATEIVREYFESRFGIMALEMTTGEVMEQLRDHISDPSIHAAIDGFLSGADLVKFAKFSPDGEENENVVPCARRIVVETAPAVEDKREEEEPVRG